VSFASQATTLLLNYLTIPSITFKAKIRLTVENLRISIFRTNLFNYLYVCNFQELEQYCFDFFLKNQKVVMQTENWITQLDLDTKIMFITDANKFFTSCF